MANTTLIQIKNSLVNAAPITLNVAEPAYSYNSNTFFIGTANNDGYIEVGGGKYISQLQNVYSLTNSSYARANSSLNANSGGTITGDVLIRGNLNITGGSLNANVPVVYIGDNIISLNTAINPGATPTMNAGIEVDRGILPNTYLIWNETIRQWQFSNDGYTYDSLGGGSAGGYANAAFIKANAAFDKANDGFIQANTAFYQANYAFISANAGFIQANTGLFQANAAFIVANAANSLSIAAYKSQNATGNVANSGFIQANAAYQSQNATGNVANSGFIQANAAFDTGNAAFLKANSAFTYGNATGSYANSAFIQANSAFLYGNATANYTNSAFVQANSAYQSQNATGNVANSAFIQANSAFTYGNATASYANSAFIKANSAYESQNATGQYANSAFIKANSAYQSQNATGNVANSAFVQANSAYQSQNATGQYANAAFIRANNSLNANVGGQVTGDVTFVGNVTSNTLTISGSNGSIFGANTIFTNYIFAANGTVDLFAYANNAYANANAGFTKANAAFIQANSAFIYGNATANYTNSAFIQANSAFTYGNATATYANSAFYQANSAYAQANAAYQSQNVTGQYANAAYTRANNSLSANVGGTVTGDVRITGNLTVTGQTTYVNTTQTLIADNIITLNAAIDQASAPILNAGLEVDRGSLANVYLLWNESATKWTVTNDGTNYYGIASDAAESYANSAFIKANSAYQSQNATGQYANSAFYQANSAFIQANSAYAQANAAYQSQNATGQYANSAFIHANAAYQSQNSTGNYANSAFIQANSAYVQANAAFQSQNATAQYANAAFIRANNSLDANNGGTITGSITIVGNVVANTFQTSGPAGDITGANAIFANYIFGANGSTDLTLYANNAYANANAAFAKANAAFIWANAAYNQANTGKANLVNGGYTAQLYANGNFGLPENLLLRNNRSIQGDGTLTITANSLNDTTGVYFDDTSVAQIYANTLVQLIANTGGATTTIWNFNPNGTLTFPDYTIQSTAFIGYGIDNVARFTSNSAFIQANSAYQSQNATGNYANSAFIQANSAYQSQNATGNYANSAFIQANSAFTYGNATANYANSAFIKANSAYQSQNATGQYANSAFVQANSAFIYGNATANYTNSAFYQANSAYQSQNATGQYANSAFIQANSAFAYGNSTANYANSAFYQANSAYQSQNATGQYANSAFIQANAAFATANVKTQTYVQATSPAGANVDDIWIDSSSGIQYVYINSNTSNQWVEFSAYSSPLNGTANIQFADQTIFTVTAAQDLVLLSSGANIQLNASANVVTTNVVPSNPTISLGTSDRPFKNVWISNASIHMQGNGLQSGQPVKITNDANNVVIQSGGLKITGGALTANSFLDVSHLYALNVESSFIVSNATFSSQNALVKIVGSNTGFTQPPTNPGYMLHLTGKVNTGSRIVNDSFGADANTYPLYVGRAARGSAENPTAVKAGDILARYSGNGYDGTNYASFGTGRIDIIAVQDHTTLNKGTSIILSTMANNTNVLSNIANFDGNTSTFYGTVQATKGYLQLPRVANNGGDSVAVTIDFANDSIVRATIVSNMTVNFVNYIAGKSVQLWVYNRDTGGGSAHTVTHGVAATNATNQSTTKSVPGPGLAVFQYVSWSGDLANTQVVIHQG